MQTRAGWYKTFGVCVFFFSGFIIFCNFLNSSTLILMLILTIQLPKRSVSALNFICTCEFMY